MCECMQIGGNVGARGFKALGSHVLGWANGRPIRGVLIGGGE